MLVNMNIQPSTTQFKALKSIKFEGPILTENIKAKRNLLKISENKNIKNLFKKYDGEIIFESAILGSKPTRGYIGYAINLFQDFKNDLTKVKDTYIQKAKNKNLPTEELENITTEKFDRNNSFRFMGLYHNNTNDLVDNIITQVVNDTNALSKDYFTQKELNLIERKKGLLNEFEYIIKNKEQQIENKNYKI